MPINRDMDYDSGLAGRYRRCVPALTEQQTAKLRSKTVCVAGCGGIGGYVAESLARLGIGALTLIDSDRFESSNLNRQLYSLEINLHKTKVTEAQARLALVNSSVCVRALKERLEESNALKLISGCDAVVDALDSVKSRLVLENACEQAGIPFVHGAVSGWTAQISTVYPGERTLSRLYRSGRTTADADNPYTADTEPDSGGGSLPFTAMAAAAFECAQLIRILIGEDSGALRGSVLSMDLFDTEFCVFKLDGRN